MSTSRITLSSFTRSKNKTILADNLNGAAYLEQVTKLMESGTYSALIPTHEQAWLFAEAKSYYPGLNSIPVASPEAFSNVQGKICFAELADKLQIPHPQWQLITDDQITLPFPYWIKATYGTAGRSVFKVEKPADKDLCRLVINACECMAQEHINGRYGQVQAVFNCGTMIAVHTSLQHGLGAGGSAAARISVDYPETRQHIEKVGNYLKWHGSLTLDFIYSDGCPYYIECNPRMIEPANAMEAGVNFPEILIKLSSGEELPEALLIGKAGVKTHGTMALLLGCAEKTRKRKDILKTLWKCIKKRGTLTGSIEVLTPIKRDLFSLFPILIVLVQLLIKPDNVSRIAAGAVQNYSVMPETIEKLHSLWHK